MTLVYVKFKRKPAILVGIADGEEHSTKGIENIFQKNIIEDIFPSTEEELLNSVWGA